MSWGILDTKDGLWLGDDSGPRLFDNYLMARIAAQLWEHQVTGTDQGARFVAKEISDDGNWNKRDELEVKHDALKSLARIEGTRDQ
jgi:hypothetical protein